MNTRRGFGFVEKVDTSTLSYINNIGAQERIMQGDVAVLNIAT